MLNKQNIKEIYPLSSMQENMLFHSLMDSDSSAYFEQTSYTINGELNIEKFKEAMRFLINRHDILRTVFIHKNVSRPFQVVLKEVEADIRLLDASHYDETYRATYFKEQKEKDISNPFHLSEDVLMRTTLIKCSDNQYKAIWSHHHILMDGWCMSLIIQEFLEVYKALKNGHTPNLPPVTPYVNYIKWLEKQDKKEGTTYWKEYLSPVESSTSFTRKKSAKKKALRKNVLEYTLPTELAEAVLLRCKENGITVNALFQSIWSMLLSKYNYSDTVCFGSVVSGRPSQINGVESIIGLFINTIPVVTHFSDKSTIIEVAKKLQTANSQSTNYDYLPLAEVQKQSALGSNIFDHILVYENYPVATDIEKLDVSQYGFTIADVEIFEQTNYDLTVVFIPKGKEIKIKYDFNEATYGTSYMQDLHERLSFLLEQVVIGNPHADLKLLTISQNDEAQQIAKEVVKSIDSYSTQTVLDLFSTAVAASPSSIAVEFGGVSFTYQDIEQRANNLAYHLQEKGIGAGSVVAILADRSDLIIVSILGVLKSGAAYLPIDKSNPEERVAYMLSDSKSKLLITDEKLHTEVEVFSIEAINALPTVADPVNHASPQGLAYIIYTSGSTGQPKGCQLLHENLYNYIDWANEYYFSNSTAEGDTALYTSLSFDLTVTCIYAPLTRGKSIKIYPQHEEVEAILKDIFSAETAIDFIKITPAHSVLLPHVGLTESNIKAVIVGGEELKKEHISNLLSLHSELAIFNEYGPTETTVGCSVKKITSVADEITIGLPVANTGIVIVDEYLNLLPKGVEGEICVVGNSVGMGYLGKPELTEEKFINHPIVGRKIYRTGDLGAWLPSGELQFYGRIDAQTKVRGYRIETGEIEYHLTQLPEIQKAFVTATEQNTLCAYVVSTDKVVSSDVNNKLGKVLPSYMLPDVYVTIDEIPLTINGKVDQKALPSPTASQKEYIAPSSESEVKLAAIWKKVLEVEQVGLNDHFFELGGHSLKTTVLSSMILKEFEKEIKLKQIFENPVFSQQIALIEGKATSSYVRIEEAAKKESYPVSFAQQRLYLLHQLDKESIAYNIPAILQINGAIDVKKLEVTLQQLVDRHEALRTSFHMEKDVIVQKIVDEVTFKVEVVNVSNTSIEQFIQPFDVSKAPLIRLVLGRVDENQHLLLLDMHHIISDAVSMSVFIREFTALYNNESLESISLHYKDFAEWQQAFSSSEAFIEQKNYWLEEYAEVPEPIELPYTSARPKNQSFDGDAVTIDLERDLLKRIEKLGKEKDATLYMTLLAAFHILIHKYSGQKDIVTGSPVSGRTHPDVQNMLGVFINTLPIRNILDEKATFSQLLESIKDKALKAFDHQDYPFEALVEELEISRDLSRNPLFDIMFSMQNADNKMPSLGDVELFTFPQEHTTSKFDLMLDAIQFEDGLSLKFEYATALFERPFIQQFSIHFLQLLEQIASTPDIAIADIDLMSEKEKHVLLQEFNATDWPFEDELTLHQLFENQAAATPDAIALVYEGESLTYRQLNEKSNQLAYILIASGIHADDIVGLIVHRSMEMVISILAIQKAGGAYMPIDPEVPSERLKYLLADSKAKVVLTNVAIDIDDHIKKIDVSDPSVYKGDIHNPNAACTNQQLAYVIYTSGSTGQPKGVMLEHKGVVNRIQWMKEKYGFSAKETVLQKTTYTFDVSVWEFFMTLCYGAKLVLCKKEVISNVDLLVDIIEKENISTLHFVPSMFKVFLSELTVEKANRLGAIKTIFTSGEALHPEHVHLHHRFLKAELHNLYGPTEASVDVSYFTTSATDKKVPIGKPVWNTQLLILDERLRLVPIGVSGELHIGGVQVARGYLNKPVLTDEKFIPNPFHPHTKLYKTGDVARWLPDGNIEYLGRSDFQVKIRGFRIELGDIETQLLKMGQFKDLAVIDKANKEGEKYLCAYIVSKNELEVDAIRTYLAQELPEYMIPSFFMRIDQLPLSSSGKLDRKALPEPTFGSLAENKTECTSDTEVKLATIWKNVLRLDEVYLEDNFFHLGGHSLKAAIVVSRIQKAFHVQITIKDIFVTSNLKELAKLIENASAQEFHSIQKANPAHAYPLSPSQRRLFVVEQFESTGTTYNMPGAFHIYGKLDKDKVKNAFDQLVQRHESLRTSFITEGETPMQIIHQQVVLNYEETKGNASDIKTLFGAFVIPFDLSQPSLFKIKLIEISLEHHVLFFDMHHIISDGVSMQILIDEFGKLYKGVQLSPLHLQYKDVAVWQQKIVEGKGIGSSKEFWLTQFQGEIPVLELPTDYPRPALKEYKGETIAFNLTKEQTAKLREFSSSNGSSIFSILFTAYTVLLHKMSGQQDVVVGYPVAGRSHADLEGMIGMFVNTLALRNPLDVTDTFAQLLHQVSGKIISSLDHQDYPFEELVRQLKLTRDMSRTPLFDTMFSYQELGNSTPNTFGEINIEPLEMENGISKFDLLLDVVNAEYLTFSFQFSTSLFRRETIIRLSNYFTHILQEVVDHPNKKISDIELVTTEERKTVVHDFNATALEVDYSHTLVQQFEHQVSLHPEAKALQCGKEHLTYEELNRKANAIAISLREIGVKPNDLVALMLDRSVNMIVGMMGVLKSGAAYVPIDPSFPKNRIDFILEDCAAKAVVGNSVYQSLTPSIPFVDVDNISSDSVNNPVYVNKVDDLAYSIYTSGSTGQPKGVLIEHRNVLNLVAGLHKDIYAHYSGKLQISLIASYIFDASVQQIFASLLQGHTLHIISQEVKENGQKLMDYYAAERIQISDGTPAFLQILISDDVQFSNYLALQHFIIGGEALNAITVRKLLSKFTQRVPNVTNVYGPTECCVDATSHLITEDDLKRDAIISIGKPMANHKVYILDSANKIQPLGVAGELCISGSSVGRHYLNRPELSASKFIPNPFQKEEKLYKTGDLARWKPDGTLEFMGRMDFQVKIRGYRIELGDIESQLQALPEVSDTVVIDKNGPTGDKYLCAYIVSDQELDTEVITAKLKENLPDYMIPQFFVRIDSVPLTTSKKVDRRALPEIEFKGSKDYKAPGSIVEKHLAEIWQNVLNTKQVGLNDNFFDLGGDSIKAIQVAARLKSKGFRIDIQNIFKHPVLQKLALIAVPEVSEVDQRPVTGTAPLTPIQAKFIKYYQGDKNHFNQSVMLFSAEGFHLPWLESTFTKIIEHHDALRSSFSNDRQTVSASVLPLLIEVIDTNEPSVIEQKTAEFQQSFHINKGNLVKLAMFKTTQGDHLLIIIHHLVVDGVSWRIILEDFNTLYTQLSKGEELQLPLKTNAFIDWGSGLSTLANQRSFIRKNAYWLEQEQTPTNLFKAYEPSSASHYHKVHLSKSHTDLLLKKANKRFNTAINDLLITALGTTLERHFGKKNIAIQMEGHGRENIIPGLDISRTVGWFTSEFPLLYTGGTSDLATAVIQTKEALRQIPFNGVGYGILDQLTDEAYKQKFTSSSAQVLFNYLGQFDDTVASDWFSISSLSSGQNSISKEMEYPLQANGMVVDEQLKFEFEADAAALTESELQSFTHTFQQQLESIIALCASDGKMTITPSDYGLKNVSFSQLEKIQQSYPHNIEKIYSLSPMQQGMLFVNMMEGEDDAYFEQSVLSIDGKLEIKKVEDVFNQLIQRHEIIRSNICYNYLPRPYSVIQKEKFASVYFKDFSDLDTHSQREQLKEFLEQQKAKGFDLSTDLLMNISVFKFAENEFKIVWSHHHIIMDGWCLGILLNDFFKLYNDHEDQLTPITPYSDYINWLENQDKEAAMEYWQGILSDYPKKVEVPGKIREATAAERNFVEEKIELSHEQLSRLETIAKSHQVTIFNIIQTIWGVLLQKYNSTDNAVFGSIVSGRPTDVSGVEQIVGLFINTIPVNVSREHSFIDTVVSVQHQFNNSDRYSFVSLNDVQGLSDFKNELIDHVIVYESYPLDENAKKLNEKDAGIAISDVETHEITNYDFTVTVIPADHFTIAFDYNTSVYDGAVIKQMVKSFDNILQQVTANPSIPVDRIELLHPEEVQELLALNPQEVNPVHNSFIEMFNSAVGSYGENTALKYEHQELSYADLNNRSNAIAHALLDQGIQRNDVVGIYTKPCFEMVEGILGILKTGAAYLPIDINYPEERIAYMLQDSKAKAVLFTGDELKGDDTPFFDLKNDAWKSADTSTPTVHIEKHDGAYIIYTSGSTGTPKGVVISQESFVDYVEMINEKFAISENDTMLQHASIAFDTTIEELYPILSVGGKMVLPKDNKDFVEMLDHIASGEITYFCTSPLVLNYINEENKGLGNLRLVTVGGDELKKSYINNIIKQVSIHNGYGPTESTVCATYYEVKGDEDLMPIGTPFRNRSAYVCNHDGNLLPKGIAGELCVGGKGLALKYLNQPEMTAEKFVLNPYDPSAKIYKTGDLVRWNEAGVLDFFGRIDNQIQIRGFRVELGEVEAKINAIDGVSEVAVLAWEEEETNSKFLCAYIVSKLTEEDVLARLDGKLPEYMIPSKFVFLDKLPLTTNGKVDRKKLEKPELLSQEVVEAESDRQEILVKVWKEVLKKDNIGITNNFFSLGGDSIKAIQVASKVQQYELKLDMRDLFAHPTIEQLEPYLTELTFKADQGLVSGQFDLTPIQKQFFEENVAYPHHYNQSLMLYSKEAVSEENWRKVLLQLVEHHDALRTRFDKNGTSQHIHTELEKSFSLQVFAMNGEEEISAKAQELQSQLNIYDGPLISSAIFKTANGTHVLLAIHHLVIDGISWRIILEDIERLISGETLPRKTQSFGSWSEVLAEYANSNVLLEELPYWEESDPLSNVWSYDNITYDSSKKTAFEFDETLTKALLEEVNVAYNTEVNDILMAALALSLAEITGRQENKIYLEGHGRENVVEQQDISRTVGWFTSMFPVKLENHHGELSDHIKNIKESLRKIPNKGVGYGILRYMNAEVAASKKLHAIPEITFNYLGQYEEEDEGAFHISNISPGYAYNQANAKESAVDISGIVQHGKLIMDVTFDPSVTSEGAVEDFIASFTLHLKNIISHCLGKEGSEKTVSDFADADLSNDELDDIMGMLDGI